MMLVKRLKELPTIKVVGKGLERVVFKGRFPLIRVDSFRGVRDGNLVALLIVDSIVLGGCSISTVVTIS